MKKRKPLYIILFTITLVVALLGIFLPGVLVKDYSTTLDNAVTQAPSEYFNSASSAVARNASSQLSDYQRMQLISGAWDSNITSASLSESSFSEYQIVTIAENGIEKLYDANLYPCSLKSGYGNWFSWHTEFYKAVDTTFNTYSSFFWIITFTKYDESEVHKILMTDDGRIIYALALDYSEEYSVKPINNMNYLPMLSQTTSSKPSTTPNTKRIPDYQDNYEDFKIYSVLNAPTNLSLYNISLVYVGDYPIENKDTFITTFSNNYFGEYYYLFQMCGNNSYAIGLMPYYK